MPAIRDCMQATGHILYKTYFLFFQAARSVVHTQANMFSSTPETTAIHYARKALTVGGYFAAVLFVPLMLEEKYKHTCTYLLPVIALLSWGICGIVSYRPYAPSHVQARWDGAVWVVATVLYAALHICAALHIYTLSRGACAFFTVFGAPAITLTAGYAAVGRFYNERLADEAAHPHMRERNAAADAARIAELKKIGLLGLEIIMAAAATMATFALLNETMKASARGYTNMNNWILCAMPTALFYYFTVQLNIHNQKYKTD